MVESNSLSEVEILEAPVEYHPKVLEVEQLPPSLTSDAFIKKTESIIVPDTDSAHEPQHSNQKIIRIGEGTYTFGSKRIHVKVLNGKLVIRVGGGYMTIKEFLQLYTLKEIEKMRNGDRGYHTQDSQ